MNRIGLGIKGLAFLIAFACIPTYFLIFSELSFQGFQYLSIPFFLFGLLVYGIGSMVCEYAKKGKIRIF
jgi:hypothetical protein